MIEELNYYVRQETHMGVPDGDEWVETAVPGSHRDRELASGWGVNGSGEKVPLDGMRPRRICADAANVLEDGLDWWKCGCPVCSYEV